MNMKKLIVLIFLLINIDFDAKANSKGELNVTLQSSIISLDPGGIQDAQSLFVSRQVNCQLVRSQGSNFTLEAAESIKYVTPENVMLKISNTAKFHDGSQIKSEDVIASLNYIKKSRNIFGNLFVWIKEIKSIDDKTVIFTLKKPIPQFLKVLSSVNFSIYKKNFIVKAKRDKTLWKRPVGCGEYEVAGFDNDKITLAPVTHGLPVVFHSVKENALNAADIDEYDIVTVRVIGKSNQTKKFNLLRMFDPTQYFLGLNTKSDFWKTKSERCNFLTQINTKKLLTAYGPAAVEPNDLIPGGVLGYSAESNYTKEMADLNTPHAVRESVKSNNRPICIAYLTVSLQDKYINEYIAMIKNQYSDVILRPIADVKKFGRVFVDENCDILLFGFKTSYFDGYEYLTIFENNDANFSGIKNKSLNSHIIASQLLTSSCERAREYRKIISKIRDLCIVRPLVTVPVSNIYIRKNLRTPGIGLDTIYQYNLANVSR